MLKYLPTCRTKDFRGWILSACHTLSIPAIDQFSVLTKKSKLLLSRLSIDLEKRKTYLDMTIDILLQYQLTFSAEFGNPAP